MNLQRLFPLRVLGALACTLLAAGTDAQVSCSERLKDQTRANRCLEADSTPKIGKLFPNSLQLNVSARTVFTLTDASFVLDGQAAEESFAAAVAGAGDVDADGVEDFVVGAPNDETFGTTTGRFDVISGRDGSVLFSGFGGSNGASAKLGSSVDGAGDVNGDGFADVIVGEPHNHFFTTQPGFAHIYYGPDGTAMATIPGDAAGDVFGASVAGVGDLNGDGRDDLLVGATGGEYARVFSGATLTNLFPTALSGTPDDNFGTSVAAAGDVNGDGTPDLLVGAPADSSAPGRAYTFSGVDGSLLVTYVGDEAGDRFGSSVSGTPDANGDGRADIVVGAPFFNGIRGQIKLLSGAGDVELIPPIVGPNAQDLFGFLVHGLADLNDDGFPEFMSRASLSDGKVRVFSGVDGTVIHEIVAEATNDAIGSGLGSTGTRLLIGAAGHDTAGSNSGRFYVHATQGVGIGTLATDDKLTVAGVVSSQSGGLRFPDGTTQDTADRVGPVGDEGPQGDPGPIGPPASVGVLTLNGQGNQVTVAGGPQVDVSTSTNAVIVSPTQGAICSAGTGPVPGSTTQYSPGAQCFNQFSTANCPIQSIRARRWTCQPNGTWSSTILSQCVWPQPRPTCF